MLRGSFISETVLRGTTTGLYWMFTITEGRISTKAEVKGKSNQRCHNNDWDSNYCRLIQCLLLCSADILLAYLTSTFCIYITIVIFHLYSSSTCAICWAVSERTAVSGTVLVNFTYLHAFYKVGTLILGHTAAAR